MNSFVSSQAPASDFQQITVSTTAVGITAAKLNINLAGGKHRRPVRILVSVEAQPCRYRFDGTAPTSAIGHLCPATSTYLDHFVIEGEQNIQNLKFIRSGASDSTVNVTIFYNI